MRATTNYRERSGHTLTAASRPVSLIRKRHAIPSPPTHNPRVRRAGSRRTFHSGTRSIGTTRAASAVPTFARKFIDETPLVSTDSMSSRVGSRSRKP